jgi:hypothetical protein
MAVSDSSSTETYNLADVLKGDTFNGVQFTVTVNGTPKDLTSTVITCDFRSSKKTGPVSLSLSIGSGITIVDAINGVFEIDAFDANMDVGIHYYDIQFVDGAVTKTYIEGTIKVFQDVT